MKPTQEEMKKANPFMYGIGQMIGYIFLLPVIIIAILAKLIMLSLILIFLASPIIAIVLIIMFITGAF